MTKGFIPTRCAALLLALALPVLITSHAAGTSVRGNDWRALDRAGRLSYVLAALDAWQLVGVLPLKSPDAAVVKTQFVDLPACTAEKGMTGAQVLAIVEKYVTDNPDKWHEPMALLIWRSMHDVCSN